MKMRSSGLPLVKIRSDLSHVGRFFWQWHHFACPHCGGDLGKSLSAISVGPSRRVCPSCWKEYLGPGEWPQLSFGERFDYLFPMTVLMYLGLAVVLVVTGAISGDDSHEKLFLGSVAFALFFIPWLPYFAKRFLEITRSKARRVKASPVAR
jgi:hypothetical protein